MIQKGACFQNYVTASIKGAERSANGGYRQVSELLVIMPATSLAVNYNGKRGRVRCE
jgi:hypothetical protein